MRELLHRVRQYSYELPDKRMIWIDHKNHTILQNSGLVQIRSESIYLSKYWFTGIKRFIKV